MIKWRHSWIGSLWSRKIGYWGFFQFTWWWRSLTWRFPLIEIYLRIPLIKIQSVMFAENLDSYAYEYVRIEWKVWKWEGHFRIYTSKLRYIK